MNFQFTSIAILFLVY